MRSTLDAVVGFVRVSLFRSNIFFSAREESAPRRRDDTKGNAKKKIRVNHGGHGAALEVGCSGGIRARLSIPSEYIFLGTRRIGTTKAR